MSKTKREMSARQKASKTRKATAAEVRAVEWVEQNGGVLITQGR